MAQLTDALFVEPSTAVRPARIFFDYLLQSGNRFDAVLLRFRAGTGHPWRRRGLTAGPVVDAPLMAGAASPAMDRRRISGISYIVRDANDFAVAIVRCD